MKQITIFDTIGALCQDDYKGINNQYVEQGKVVIIESICGSAIRWLGRSAENRTTTAFRWNYGGGTESIVVEDKVYPIEGNGTSDSHQGKGWSEDKTMYTLNTVEQHAVAQLSIGGGTEMAVDAKNFVEDKINGTLTSASGHNTESNNLVRQYAVRRLTPLECERLQSLPDGWTKIDHKTCSDSARYKALGNGMSQNVPDWLLKRLVKEVENAEMETEP